MKVHVLSPACAAVFVAAAVMMLAGCGGRQTMASKSAAAYDEAMKKAIPIPAREHGGHSVESAATQPAPDHASMRGMEQPAMPGMPREAAAARTHDRSGMNQSAMAEMDHAKMPGMEQGATAGGAHDMAGMNYSAMAGMDRSRMQGMQHGAMAAPVIEIEPPTTNAAIAQTQPSATLRADTFDTPAATSIKEAARAASSKSQSMGETMPKPPSPNHHQGNGEAP